MKIDSLTSATLDQDRTLSISITGTTDNGVMSFDNDINDGMFVSPSIKIEPNNSGTRNNLALSADATIELGTGGDNATDYSGTIIKLGGGSTTQGKVYYYKSATSQWSTAQANHIGSTYWLAYAIGTDPDEDGMMLHGIVSSESHGFTPGFPLYVSEDTAGAIKSSAPGSSGEYVRIVGYAINADQIYFCPDNTFIERG